MNINEILNMLSGLEMDALIAEKVFGRTLVQSDNTASYIKTPNGYEDLRRHGNYSTDISAAWEVVEKMTEYDLHIMSGRNFKRYPNMPYGAKFENKNWSFVALGETAPLAICRAALLAITKEK